VKLKILSVDPGLRCGYAVIEFGGKVLDNGVVLCANLPDYLEKLDRESLVTVVVEDYRVYRSHAEKHTGSKVEAVQAIGMLDLYARMFKLHLVKQSPFCFKIGAKYLGATIPKGHLADNLSALYHGIYYLKSIDQYKTALEKRL
jgi:hypothetical protein